MALKRSVPENSGYAVSYSAEPASAGALLVLTWVPKHGNPVPPAEDVVVPPGATRTLRGQVPAAALARRLDVDLHLPDGQGSGALSLSIEGTVVTQERVHTDVVWTFLVE